GGEEQRAGEVVREAAGQLGDQVGGGGGDDHEVGGAGELDMAHLGLGGEVEEPVVDLVAGQCRDGERGDELGAGPGEDGRDRGAGLLQQADELEALVGGDAAADDQQYPAARQHAPLASRTRMSRVGGEYVPPSACASPRTCAGPVSA